VDSERKRHAEQLAAKVVAPGTTPSAHTARSNGDGIQQAKLPSMPAPRIGLDLVGTPSLPGALPAGSPPACLDAPSAPTEHDPERGRPTQNANDVKFPLRARPVARHALLHDLVVDDDGTGGRVKQAPTPTTPPGPQDPAPPAHAADAAERETHGDAKKSGKKSASFVDPDEADPRRGALAHAVGGTAPGSAPTTATTCDRRGGTRVRAGAAVAGRRRLPQMPQGAGGRAPAPGPARPASRR